jgi:epoxide hydrolase-like predicted phosphatase
MEGKDVVVAVRAVVFDIGGVLEVTPNLEVFPRWEARLGLAPGEFVERTGQLWLDGNIGVISLDEVHAGLSQSLGLARPTVEELMEDIWTEYVGTPDVALIEYFRGLRPRYLTALLSNSFVGAREREQELYGFAELTDLIVYSHEVGLSKPDPRIYELTCERLDVRPHEGVFVDDKARNIDAARDLGMHAILHESTPQSIAEIDALLAS